MRDALGFLAAARRDPALRDALAAVGASAGGLEEAVLVAARFGFTVGAEDLRVAFATDWGLRRALHLDARGA